MPVRGHAIVFLAAACVVAVGGPAAIGASRVRRVVPKVSCVGSAPDGVVVQVIPARKGVRIAVRGADRRRARGRTDLIGRAAIPGSFAATVRVTVGNGAPRSVSVGPCPVAVSAVGPEAFVPVSGRVKGRGPLTLGFGSGEIVAPGGALQSGIELKVMRAPKSIVTDEPTAGPSVSGPIEITTTGSVLPSVPFEVSLAVPNPLSPSGESSVVVVFESAPVITSHLASVIPIPQASGLLSVASILPARQVGNVIMIAVPGPGVVEVFERRVAGPTPTVQTTAPPGSSAPSPSSTTSVAATGTAPGSTSTVGASTSTTVRATTTSSTSNATSSTLANTSTTSNPPTGATTTTTKSGTTSTAGTTSTLPVLRLIALDSDASIVSGGVGSGVVRFDRPVDARSVLVTLVYSSWLTGPQSVAVLGGFAEASFSFTVRTGAPSAVASTITATFGTTQLTRTVVVNPIG